MSRRIAASRLGTLLVALATTVLLAPAVAPTVALGADPADLRLDVQQGTLSLQAGGQPATLVFSIHNDGPGAADSFVANVNVPFGDRGVAVASSSPACNQVGGPTVLSCPVSRLESGQTTTFTLVIQAPGAGALQQGEVLTGTGQIAAADPGGDDTNPTNDAGQFTLNVTGAPQPVTQTGGAVADGTTGQPLAGVAVSLRDTNGLTCSTTTDASGNFNCTPPTPLAGGSITIVASLSGYQTFQLAVTPANGQIAGVQLSLTKIAAVPSPTPSAVPTSASPSASPEAEVLPAKDDGGSGWTTVFYVLGVLVVLAGLGGVAWWMYKRRDTEVGPDPRPGSSDFEHAMPTVPIALNRPIDATLVGTPTSGSGYATGPTVVQTMPLGGGAPNPASGATTVVSALPSDSGDAAFPQTAPGGGVPSPFAHDPGASSRTAAWDAGVLHQTEPIGMPDPESGGTPGWDVPADPVPGNASPALASAPERRAIAGPPALTGPTDAPPAERTSQWTSEPAGWGGRPDDRYYGTEDGSRGAGQHGAPETAVPSRSSDAAGYWYASRADSRATAPGFQPDATAPSAHQAADPLFPAGPPFPAELPGYGELPGSRDAGRENGNRGDHGYGALYADGYPQRPAHGQPDEGQPGASRHGASPQGPGRRGAGPELAEPGRPAASAGASWYAPPPEPLTSGPLPGGPRHGEHPAAAPRPDYPPPPADPRA